ncbi:MAG TPA: homoserine dehydrogenase [Candidatus Limnocylindria bacterium]|nr:homoserine dehydrogenase [Candidatus Limnocylindria bacterium]
MHRLKIGLIGGGTVGGGVYQAIQRNGALMASRLGVTFEVTRVAVRDLNKTRTVEIPEELLTTDWKGLIDDPEVDIVVELIGGITTAREVVARALKQSKAVVTANKALLSAHGPELFDLAIKHGANLYYEASVAGGIPIIKVLRESLVGNRISRIAGIVNGTCNYILTRMKLERAEFATVLAEAQRLGYAEAEPSLDVDGHDAAHKTGILASLAFGFWVKPGEIHTEGIRSITPLDIQFAGQLGYTIKLLGVVKSFEPEKKSGKKQVKAKLGVQVAVYPALVPNSHVLASVNYAFNAISVRGDIVGDTLFYGSGAGQDPTTSSVLSDLADAALDLTHGCSHRVPAFSGRGDGGVVSLDQVVARYYLRLSVVDKPGVLARVSSVLGRAGIGISSVIQPEGHVGESVPLILMLHDSSNKSVQRALAAIRKLNVVKEQPVLIRVESLE